MIYNKFVMELGGYVYNMVDDSPLIPGENVNDKFPIPRFHLIGMQYKREFGGEEDTSINYA